MARRPKKSDYDIQGELQFEEYAPQLRRMRPKLRPDTDIIPQSFRGKTYFVLQDPVTLQYYRVGETEREILAALDGETTLEEIHGRLKKKYGPRAPSFREVAHFALSLRHANLTTPEGVEDTRWAVERTTKKRRQLIKQKLSNFMYITFPLLDPERFLNATVRYVGWIFSKPFFFVWLATVSAAVFSFFYHAEEFLRPANSLLAKKNLLYLWLAFVLIKTCHEFGHAYAAKKHGAEVHRMGVMMLIFMPCWYVDTTPVWALPNKWRRALVGAAGMMVELFIASLALFAWLALEPSGLRTVLYNMIFIASVSTILFNGNPLLRYDAYYILVDLAEIPNLRQRSTEYILYLAKKYLIGEKLPPMTQPRREKIWFVTYGVLATIYRCFVVAGIILLIASKLFFLGVAIASVVAVLWVVTPAVKLVKYIFFAKNTRPVRARAVGVFAVFAASIFLLVGVMPLSASVYAPCALEPHDMKIIRAEWPGFVEAVYVEDGEPVEKGRLLAEAQNDELDYLISLQKFKIKETLVRLAYEQTRSPARAAAERKVLEVLEEDLETLYKRKKSLTFRAPFNGRVIAPNLERYKGMRFLELGGELFTVASLDALRVIAVVSDADIGAVSRAADRPVRIKFDARPKKIYTGKIVLPLPGNTTSEPPPAALTNIAGGPVLLDPQFPEGRTLYPWYRVEIVLDAGDDELPVGATGSVRFIVGKESLGSQIKLKLQRMLSRRFLTF